MDTSKLTPYQRQQRLNIKNYFLTSSVTEMMCEMEYRTARGDKIGAETLYEMVEECKRHGVDNYGDCPL